MKKFFNLLTISCLTTAIAICLYNIRPSIGLKSTTPLTISQISPTPILPPTGGKAKPPPTPKPAIQTIPQKVLREAPFTSQAPLGEWSDPLQQDGCEEASVLMAVLWGRNQNLESSQAYKDAIIAISQWEESVYGTAKDTSAEDTVERIFKGFFEYDHAFTKSINSHQEIIDLLTEGNIIVAPMNGQTLGNPHYVQPGPERHMLVIKGYDLEKSEFITNDPGTRFGEGYRYNFQKLYTSIRDYPTGNHLPITTINRMIIIVRPE